MRQHRWARVALARVSVAATLDEKARNEYRSLCRNLPVLLRRSGIAQSLTFLESRSGERGDRVLHDLASVYGIPAKQLVDRAVNIEKISEYLVMSRDLLAIAGWMRRFADAVLPSPSTDAGTAQSPEDVTGAPTSPPSEQVE